MHVNVVVSLTAITGTTLRWDIVEDTEFHSSLTWFKGLCKYKKIPMMKNGQD